MAIKQQDEYSFIAEKYTEILETYPITLMTEQLPLNEINDDRYSIERAANNIAKKTRRGKANLVLYNSTRLPQLGRPLHFYFDYAVPQDEYILVYAGPMPHDRPFARDGAHWYAHPNWQDYCFRFKFRGNDENGT